MNDLANEIIADLLEGQVKHKNSNLRRVKGLIRYVPEVMVKITGNTKSRGHLTSHFDYISRDGKLEVEDESGGVMKGKASVRELAKDWLQDKGKKKLNTRETTNIVLSMPSGTESMAVKDAAREFAKHQFGMNHQYVFVLHTDTDSPHVHLTVKNLGFNGHRLHVKKGDPQKWREAFAGALYEQGIEAGATTRAVRGIVKKSVKSSIYYMRKRGMTPSVDRAKIKEIVEDFSNEGAVKALQRLPWEVSIKERQAHIRKQWISVAKHLYQSKKHEDNKLANDIISFVDGMPSVKTERQELQEQVMAYIQSNKRGRDGEIEQDDLAER